MDKHELTEEVRRELLGLVPFSMGSTDEYTPPQFLKQDADGNYLIPESFRPVFKIRSLSVEERRGVAKMLQSLKDTPEDVIVEAARKVVVGWRNLIDAGSGKEILFKAAADGGADAELLSALPPAITGALLFHSCRISGVISAEKLSLR